MRKFGITFWFYAQESFKKKSLIILAVVIAATVGITWAIDHFGGGSNAQIAIVQESATFVVDTDLIVSVPDRDFFFPTTEAEARQMLEDGDVDDVFVIQGTDRPALAVVTSNLNPDNVMLATLLQILTGKHIEVMATYYDLPIDMVIELMTPIATDIEIANFEDVLAAEIINMALPWIIYMLVMMSGTMVANSVASEKTSRVMEVMLGKVHPTITMISKVLSSLMDVLLLPVAIGIGLAIAHFANIIDMQMVLDMINEFFPLNALLLTLVVAVLGYFCFIFLFAAAGAISNSVESLTKTMAPLTYATMIPIFVAMWMDIGGTVMDILVYVPLVSPYVLVQRFMLGYSSMVEVGISLAIMAAFAVVMLIISARLYMNGIFHNSEKVTLKDLRKMLQK